ncbi:MAG TPA: hypothetical protein VFB50_12385 [Chloroflexota bacterium]|nr:hypothetical protein [Chloroflexota bacterium]
MRPTDFELSAVEVAEALGGVVGDSTIRNWVAGGLIPSAYVWRSPTGRMYFKRKLVAWLLAGGEVQQPAPAAKPKAVRVRAVRWDRAS